VTPRCWRTSSALDDQLANMTFCNPPYNVEYASTPKDKTPPQAPPDTQRRSGAAPAVAGACGRMRLWTRSDPRTSTRGFGFDEHGSPVASLEEIERYLEGEG
jgi:hypothetical protein